MGNYMRDSREAIAARLAVRLVVLVSIVIAVAAVLYLAWSQAAQEEAVDSKVLAEARTLNTEMRAVWDYIDDSQAAINYNSDGSYDFKGIYCSVAGKGIAKRFTRQADGYVIRYVRENPRSGTDIPDAFEAEALDRFSSGSATEHYGMENFEGRMVFRYASALTIKRNCLACHGEPAGEPDETGFLREGMQMNDLAGAVSIVIPIEAYEDEARSSLMGSVGFFLVLAVAISVILCIALKRWVAKPLEQENAQLQNESEEKSNFLAIMSHELRTPLSSIIAYADIWDKTVRHKTPSEEKIVREIKENSVALLGMVNNTIDVARIEAGSFEVQYDDVDLVDVVNAVFSVAEPLAIKQGIALTKAIDAKIPIMHSDWEALRKIILNLTGNALKFTDRGGSVSVSARYEADGEAVVVSVRDTGAGIAAEDFEKIFGRFTQAGCATPYESDGSGLGLFLVKSLVGKLGGSITVESEVGEGSTFTVHVPVNCCDESEQEQCGR